MATFEAISDYSDAADRAVNSQFRKASAMLEDGDSDGAYDLMLSLEGSEEAAQALASDERLRLVALDREYQAGAIVTFGTYEQDDAVENGKEPLTWQVLDRDGNKALLLTEKGIDAVTYNNRKDYCSWRTCSLRRWMNGYFFNEAFSADEQQCIAETTVKAAHNYQYRVRGGWDTRDKVFCLSFNEVKQYLPEKKDRRMMPTAVTEHKQAYVSEISDGSSWWWTRTPGTSRKAVMTILADGTFQNYYVDLDLGAVRPALWVDLEQMAK